MFRKITIVGVGLMGGSLGLAVKKHRLAREVVGLSYKEASLAQALKVKAIDAGFTDTQKALRNSDLVVFATPVETISKIMPVVSKAVHRNCILTDVGSTKAEIVDIAQKTLSSPGNFVGAHPLAGSEKKGAEFATPDLYKGAKCIITPTDVTSNSALEKVKVFWSRIGCDVKIMTPQSHDEILGFISHLPHLAAFGLIESIPSEFLEFITPSLRDTTRIASSAPQMWADICIANAGNIVKALDEYVRNLSVLRKSIMEKDAATLLSYFTKAKGKRDNVV